MFQEIEDIDQNQESRSRSGSHVSTNRHRLRCFRYSEYDHFARECPNMMTEGDSDEESLEPHCKCYHKMTHLTMLKWRV